MDSSLFFGIISAVISIGGVLIAIGVFKSKITQAAEDNKNQDEQMKALVTKHDLAAAMKRSDELLEDIKKRADEDRAKGQGEWREFHGLLSNHESRIKVIEERQGSLVKSLDEIKGDIKSGFRQLQDELKEIRNKH